MNRARLCWNLMQHAVEGTTWTAPLSPGGTTQQKFTSNFLADGANVMRQYKEEHRGNVSAPGIFCDPCPTGGLLLLICWATSYGNAP